MTDLERCEESVEELTDFLTLIDSACDRLDQFCAKFEAGGQEIVETTESVEIIIRDFNQSLEMGSGRIKEAKLDVQNGIYFDDKLLNNLLIDLQETQKQFESKINRDRATMGDELDEMQSVFEGIRETWQQLGKMVAQTVEVVVGELKISDSAIANLQTQVAINQDKITVDFENLKSEIREIYTRSVEIVLENFSDILSLEIVTEIFKKFEFYIENITNNSENFIAHISDDADRFLSESMKSLEMATDRMNHDRIPEFEQSVRDATDRGMAEMTDAIEDYFEALEQGEKMTTFLDIISQKIVTSKDKVSSI